MERDLGVLVNIEFNMNEQCAAAAKKVSEIWAVSTKAPEEMKSSLLSTLFRLHLENCVQFCSLLHRKDGDTLDSRVQRMATKMIRGQKSLPCLGEPLSPCFNI